jgi:hypothetical protein
MACESCASGNVAEQLDLVTTKTPADGPDDEESLRRKALTATGATLLHGDPGSLGIRVGGWCIQTRKAPILKMGPREK